MVDENGKPPYLGINSCFPSSSNHIRPTVLHRELDLFYDTQVVCGYSKCHSLKVNPRRLTLSHYINDQLPKVDSLIPPIVVKDLIGDRKET